MVIHHRPAPTILHPIAENQRSIPSERDPLLALILPVVVHEDDVERMEVTRDEATSSSINMMFSPLRERNESEVEERDVPEDSEQYVEKYIRTTACYEEDS
jgi:hypothetical protein